jgi:hypothetical protein
MGVCGRRLDKVRLSALSGGWVRSRFEPQGLSQGTGGAGVRGHFLGVGADFRVGLRPPSPRRSAGQGWARPESRLPGGAGTPRAAVPPGPGGGRTRSLVEAVCRPRGNRKNGGRSRRYRSVLKGMRCPPSSSDHGQPRALVLYHSSPLDPNDEPVRLSAVRRGWLRLAMESAAQSSSLL